MTIPPRELARSPDSVRPDLVAQLALSKAHLGLALEAGAMGTWEWDIVGQRVIWSAQEERLYGLEPGTFDGTVDSYLARIFPDDVGPAWRAVEEAIAKRAETHHIVHRIIRPNGDVRWLDSHGRFIYDADGHPLRLVGVSTDVTDRIRFERSRERQDEMLGAVDIGFWYCDLPFSELIWDRKVKEHFWLPTDERITIDTFYNRLHPADRERTRDAIETSITSHTPYDIEYRTVAPAEPGEPERVRCIRAIGYTAYNPRGEPIRFDGITVDVTEQVQTRREIEQKADALARLSDALVTARNDAELANRTKSEFLARMSHDLRTPLNAIGGYSQLLEMEVHGPVTEAQRVALRRIQRAQDHLLTLINDILAFAKLEAGQVQVVSDSVPTRPVLEELTVLVMPEAAARGLRLEVDPGHEDARVRADRARLVQILLNLASNAVKFTDAGCVSISVANVGDRVHFRVADTGCGIPADRIAAIFDPFVQVQSRVDETRGVGLGLAISRELARLMGGTVDVSSTEGVGSTFVLDLPSG
jgi:PAS domain S-box-containing protein